MIKVSNGSCIRRLGLRAMKAARTRNIVAVLAIALTTVLFTSLFTIAASINYSYQQENFRKMGGDSHGAVKELTWEQVEDFRSDPLIVESSARLFVGMASEPPFNKSHVEISYLEPQGAPHYFCEPVAGTLPHEGTDEAAMDTHILALLGIEPEIGAKVTLPITIDSSSGGKTITRTFTLSGWWEYDSAVIANHILLPRSAAEELAALSDGDPLSMTGKWTLDVMFKNALNIRENMETLLANHGYQNEDPTAENYLKIGVSWAHTASSISSDLDFEELLAVAAILLLIVFTGYLIIYNVFQISVTNDIRFYGLLKTIGTTGRQLKRIIRQQALLLSLIGIPLGLLLGFVVGNVLTPVIMANLSYKNTFVSFNPWIFLGAAAFSLATVFLSCARPGRVAAKVSPVEALRYTEGGASKPRRTVRRRSVKKAAGGASLPKMAWANLGRSRSKTAVTVVSLTLAVVLMNLTYTFTSGFDLEKYLSASVCTDFIVGHADQFVAGSGNFRSADNAVPEALIADIDARPGITDSGRVYAKSWGIQQFVTEERFLQSWQKFSPDYAGQMLAAAERLPDGRVATDALLYGMEDFPLSRLNVVEGDLAPLRDPSQNAIAATVSVDDYGQLLPDSAWARVGDTVKLRYVTEWKRVDLATGEELTPEELDNRIEKDANGTFQSLPKVYEEREYTVCALVTVPSAISFRYGIVGGSSYVLGAERFKQDSGADLIMLYTFDTTDEANAAMEDFLADYTKTAQPIYDYESKQSYMDEFEGFRKMFLALGGALSLIIGLVGVLNFINAVLTGILTRKRELAVLQSVGMTGRQLKTMLVCEGLYYTLLSLALSLLLCLVLCPFAGRVVSGFFSFFSYRFTILPLVLILPVFLLLGSVVPLLVCRSVSRFTIVERLRDTEG